MIISEKEVAHVASLARLKLNDEQTGTLTSQLNEILTAMDKLNELDTSGVPSTNHASENVSVMRPDVVEPSLPTDEGLANAPQTDGASFVVPKVI